MSNDANATPATGLGLARYFTHGNHPFQDVSWVRRDAYIAGKDPDGPPAFEQKGVSVPEFWSQNATNIVAQKYFSGQLGTPDREWSVKQLIGRVVERIGAEGRKRVSPVTGRPYFTTDEEQEIFEHELAYILVHQMAAFNSPVWFNIGVDGVAQQCSACFILHVEDHLEDILEWYKEEGLIFQNGSGAGVNLSRLRGSMEPLERGGKASGPVTFMRGADSSAGTITSGGRTRRAAKMVVLDVDHPDIEEFIWCKAHEEEKARALAAAGFDMSLNTEEGAKNWASLQYQNANNSVRVTQEFLDAVENDGDWNLIARNTVDPETGEKLITKTVKARDLMDQIAEAAWRCADPGVQYDTTINEWHTCPNTDRINASNPCSEYLHVDNSSCNLASLNLMKFRNEDGTFNTESFKHAVDVLFTAQEILISFSDYPTDKIGDNTRAMRQIGIGYANLGAYLMSLGLPYDSDEGREVAGAITALMTGRSYRQSAVLAQQMGPYDEYAENRDAHIGVIKKHRAAANKLGATVDPSLTREAKRAWKEALELGIEHGYRNAQASVLAPTGTISFLMDCDTTGIEPDFSLIKFKKLVGGGSMTIVNQTVAPALSRLGYSGKQIEEILDYIKDNYGSIVGAPHVAAEHYPVFATAIGDNAIHHMGHLKMMAACQPFISGAISKTVNLPESTTKEDIAEIFRLAGTELKLKAVAIYRDGTKTAQPLGDGKDKAEGDETQVLTSVLGDGMLRGQKRELPDEPEVRARHFRVGSVSGYIHVHLFEDGTPGALFVNVAQAGSDLRGMIDAWAITFSRALRYGTPLDDLVSKLAFAQFGGGFTNDPAIRSAKSVVDYVVRWLAKEFLDSSAHQVLGIDTPQQPAADSVDPDGAGEWQPSVELSAETKPAASPAPAAIREAKVSVVQSGTGTCQRCGGIMIQTGKCMTCQSCGDTGGCG